MSVKADVTNERLNSRFENAFSLVNYAIGLAKNMVEKGEETSNPSTSVANHVLELIVDSHDLLQDDEDEEFDDEDEREAV